QQHGGSPNFVQTVDFLDIFVMILAQALLCLGNQVVSFAKFRRPGWTGLRAGGLLPVYNAVRAHVALADQRERLLPFVLWHHEGTCQHAVPATDAFGPRIRHRSFGCFLESPHGTYGNAGGIRAVHAQVPHELVASGLHHGELVFRLLFLACDCVVVRQTIALCAGLLTQFAADAHCRIVEDALTHDCSLERPSLGGRTIPRVPRIALCPSLRPGAWWRWTF